MTTTYSAVYERGRLRPDAPLPLQEGERVNIVVLREAHVPTATNAAELLAAIAAMPTAGGDANTSRDHDAILYGKQGTP